MTPIYNQLLPGERIIWSGKPTAGLILTGRDWLMIPFSLMWGGFAIFWEASAFNMNAPFFFRLWGVPFVLFGLYLIAGRFFVDAWIRRGIDYAVTNQRILITRSPPFGKVVTLALDRISDMNLTERSNGTGTIRFGPAGPVFGRYSSSFGAWTPALDPTPQFLAIENVGLVFSQIQQASRQR